MPYRIAFVAANPHGGNFRVKPNRRLASLVAQLVPGQTAVRLLPAGTFRAADGSGRPTDAPSWRLDADIAGVLIARHNARASRRVVDYEHQTLHAAQNGQPAPAAGWITALSYRESDGLYAEIEWSEKAAAMIAAGEYRYLSPVFTYDSTGQVLDILMAGLTNNPGLDGLTDLAALSAAFTHDLPPDQETQTMKLLLAALGLAATATETEAVAALDAIKTQSGQVAASVATLTAEIATLKAAAPDPAKYVPAETIIAMQAQIAALTAGIERKELDDMIEIGLSDGRILPDMEAWARSLNQAALKGYLDKAKPIAALGGTQTGGQSRSGASDGAPADEAAAKAHFASNAALRSEFGDEATYLGFWRADAAGRIRTMNKS